MSLASQLHSMFRGVKNGAALTALFFMGAF